MTNEKIEKIEKTENNNTQLNIEPFIPNMINDDQLYVNIKLVKKEDGIEQYEIKIKRQTKIFDSYAMKIFLNLIYNGPNGIEFQRMDETLMPGQSEITKTVPLINGANLRMQNLTGYGIKFKDEKNINKNSSSSSIDDAVFDMNVDVSKTWFWGHNEIQYHFYPRGKALPCPVKITREISPLFLDNKTKKKFYKTKILTVTLGANQGEIKGKTVVGDIFWNDMITYVDRYYLQFPSSYINHRDVGIAIRKYKSKSDLSHFEVIAWWKRSKEDRYFKNDVIVNIYPHLQLGKDSDSLKTVRLHLKKDEQNARMVTPHQGFALELRDPTYYDIYEPFTPIKEADINALVFSGGGVKGIAYAGAIEQLETEKVLGKDKDGKPKIKAVAGASAGAITALAVAVGYSPADIKDIITKKINFKDLIDNEKYTLDEIKKYVMTYPAHTSAIGDLLAFFAEDYALCKGKKAEELIGKIIDGTILGEQRKDFDSHMTFKKLKEVSGVDLHVVVSDVTRKQTRICNATETPNLVVRKAVLASMTIPLLFPPVDLLTDEYGHRSHFVDGGLTNNYPLKHMMSIIDKHHNPVYNALGFILSTSAGVTRPDMANLDDLGSYVGRVLDLATSNCHFELFQTPDKTKNNEYLKRTIFINNIGVNTGDFDILKTKQTLLIEEGKKAVKNYFHP